MYNRKCIYKTSSRLFDSLPNGKKETFYSAARGPHNEASICMAHPIWSRDVRCYFSLLLQPAGFYSRTHNATKRLRIVNKIKKKAKEDYKLCGTAHAPVNRRAGVKRSLKTEKKTFSPDDNRRLFSRKNSSNYVMFNMRKLTEQQQEQAANSMNCDESEREGNEQLTAARIWIALDASRFIIQFSTKRNEKCRGKIAAGIFVVFCKWNIINEKCQFKFSKVSFHCYWINVDRVVWRHRERESLERWRWMASGGNVFARLFFVFKCTQTIGARSFHKFFRSQINTFEFSKRAWHSLWAVISRRIFKVTKREKKN